MSNSAKEEPCVPSCVSEREGETNSDEIDILSLVEQSSSLWQVTKVFHLERKRGCVVVCDCLQL